MGIVRINENTHNQLRHAALAMNRSINAQAEHWMRIGALIEAHPHMRYADVIQHMLEQASAAEIAVRTGARN